MHAPARPAPFPRVRDRRRFGVERNQGTTRRGGLLFEVLLAVALFVGAASFSLGCVKSVFSALAQTRREQEAVDLARSSMAELEAGLIGLADLRGQPVDAVGSMRGETAANVTSSTSRPRWIVDVKTRRSEFTGLSLVELTVREDTGVSDENAASFTLRQLMPLKRGDTNDEYERDDLTAGLPTPARQSLLPKNGTGAP